jgi:hypothetical protein
MAGSGVIPSRRHHHRSSPRSHITWGMNSGCGSEMSHPIDIANQSISISRRMVAFVMCHNMISNCQKNGWLASLL